MLPGADLEDREREDREDRERERERERERGSRTRKYNLFSVNEIHSSRKSLPFHQIVIFAHLTVVL